MYPWCLQYSQLCLQAWAEELSSEMRQLHQHAIDGHHAAIYEVTLVTGALHIYNQLWGDTARGCSMESMALTRWARVMMREGEFQPVSVRLNLTTCHSL